MAYYIKNLQDANGDIIYPITRSTAIYLTDNTALDIYLATLAPLASPSLTGTPTAPTASAGTNTTQIATTAFVTTAIGNISTLDITVSSTEPSSQNTGDFWYEVT